MPRATIKIRYKVRVTRRVRVETRVRYSARIMTTARHVVSQARARGVVFSDDAQEEMMDTARVLLPPGIDDDEIRDAIDAVCEEVDEDE